MSTKRRASLNNTDHCSTYFCGWTFEYYWRESQGVNILFINDAEAQQYSNIENLDKAALKLLAKGPEFVIIKEGEHGASLYSKDVKKHLPAFRVDDFVDLEKGIASSVPLRGLRRQNSRFQQNSDKNAPRSIQLLTFTSHRQGCVRI